MMLRQYVNVPGEIRDESRDVLSGLAVRLMRFGAGRSRGDKRYLCFDDGKHRGCVPSHLAEGRKNEEVKCY